MNANVAGGLPFTTRPVSPLLMRFTAPILIGLLLQAMNGSVNALWVGRGLGVAALAALTSAASVIILIAGVVSGIGIAVSLQVGRSVGRGDSLQARDAFTQGAVVLGMVSMAVVLVGASAAPAIVDLMQVPNDARSHARDYLQTMLLGSPITFALTYVLTVVRGAGDARTPFLMLVVCFGLDVALNPVLIFGWKGIPGLGIQGSALASLIAQAAVLLLLCYYLTRSGRAPWCGIDRVSLRGTDRMSLGRVISQGLAIGSQQIIVAGSTLALTVAVNRFGKDAAAAYGAVAQLWIYVQLPGLALGIATSTIAAHNVGAGRWDRVHRLAVAAVVVSVASTSLLVMLTVVWRNELLSLFLPDANSALEMAVRVHAMTAWSLACFGVTFVLSGIMRAAGSPLAPLGLLILALWGLRIPFAYGFLDTLGADAVWWSLPLGLVVSAALSIVYYRSGHWRKRRA